MASLDEDIEAAESTAPRGAPWLRLAQLPERLAAASYAPDAFRTELRDAAPGVPPSMEIDFRYKTGIGLARFGQLGRAREAWADGMRPKPPATPPRNNAPANRTAVRAKDAITSAG